MPSLRLSHGLHAHGQRSQIHGLIRKEEAEHSFNKSKVCFFFPLGLSFRGSCSCENLCGSLGNRMGIILHWQLILQKKTVIFIWLYPEEFGKCKGNPTRKRGPRMLLSGTLTWNNHRIQNIPEAEWGAGSPAPLPYCFFFKVRGSCLIGWMSRIGKGWHVNEGKVELTFSPERWRGQHNPPPAGCSGKPTDQVAGVWQWEPGCSSSTASRT